MSARKNTEFPNIQRLFRELNKEAFWDTLDDVNLEWTDDLGPDTEGACTVDTSTNTTSIQLSRRALQSKTPAKVTEVLARQMVHAYLHSTHAIDAGRTDGPSFQKHWKRLLNLRDKHNLDQLNAPKTTGPSTSSGEAERNKPGPSRSSDQGNSKGSKWYFSPGARADERKPEVVSSDDDEIIPLTPRKPPAKLPSWMTFGPPTDGSNNPTTRPNPQSSNKDIEPKWNFQPGARANERKPEVISSDDDEIIPTTPRKTPTKLPGWMTFGPSTNGSNNPAVRPAPHNSNQDKAPKWNFRPGARADERKPEVISSDDDEIVPTTPRKPPTKLPGWMTFGPSTNGSNNPTARPNPQSSNNGNESKWNFQPGARADEREPEVVSSDDSEETIEIPTQRHPNPTVWTSSEPSGTGFTFTSSDDDEPIPGTFSDRIYIESYGNTTPKPVDTTFSEQSFYTSFKYSAFNNPCSKNSCGSPHSCYIPPLYISPAFNRNRKTSKSRNQGSSENDSDACALGLRGCRCPCQGCRPSKCS
ncbi:hypothetical protein IWQ62_000363 [Dispira parvispora]|uniref:SprT-like domain-containing protein n=1 Tax=Dispira parvispora TaxID=1520584 RepID=A0A9W8B1H9_9FUNG|nr:hypothetical protein IWQ62_000363 [Dispira parvispora]